MAVNVHVLPVRAGYRGHQLEVVTGLGTSALLRLVSELHRRRVHVEDLRYAEHAEHASLTLTVLSDRSGAERLASRLERLVDTRDVRRLSEHAPASAS